MLDRRLKLWHSKNMKRLFFFISLCVSVLISASVNAQDVIPLRAKVLDGYARLVFEWPKATTYTLDRSSENVVKITFGDAGLIDSAKAQLSGVKSVAKFDVVSEDPLAITLLIPRSSKIRDLKIGNRVILDVFDPEDAGDLGALAALSEDVKAPATAVKEPAPKVEEKQSEQEEKAPRAMPPAIVLVPENLPPKKTAEQIRQEEERAEAARIEREKARKLAIEKAVEQKEHIISLRGTQDMNMAAYESFGSLWLVVGGANSFSRPALTSPEPDIFPGLQIVQDDDLLDVYRLPLPDRQFQFKGMGGSLAWDLVMGEKVNANPVTEPRRMITSTQEFRNGAIIWPFEDVGDIVNVEEPETGQTLIVVTVRNANQLAGQGQSYVDFDVLTSHVGLVIRPRVDDLEVTKTEQGVRVTRPSGLALSLPKDLDAAALFGKQKVIKPVAKKIKDNVLLRFGEWQLGDHRSLKRRENILLTGVRGQPPSRRVQDLISLGKMFIAHGRGAEAQGYFDFAVSEMPAIEDSAELRAYRGVAKALGWKSREALTDFLVPALDGNEEINLWKAFVLADLGDWQQAASLLPDKYAVLYTYPYNIASRLAVVLAEVNLRAGNVRKAEELMTYIDSQKEGELIAPVKAALQYLKGEAARQKKDVEQTKELWGALTKNNDDLYRTKAGLALTILQANKNEIDNEEVIDRLERLRYSWRGDGLEAQVNYWLGDAYFKAKDYIKGLVIMREAASIADESVLAARITSDMADTFNSMFKEENLKDVSPLDAVAVFDQFKELTPLGSEGDKLVQRLAEHLVRSNLLSRAANLLQHQVDHRLNGKEKIRIAIRLAAIELLDKNPQKAINALSKANDTLNFISETADKKQFQHEIALLRIRAYAQNKEFKKALSLIEDMPLDPIVNRLKADIAWKANYWDIAAEALNDVIIDENIDTDEALSPEQANIILNRAIALNLDNDRISLANMREKYSALMLESNKDKARQFEVITRPRRTALLDDREALLSAVAEVDLFKEFLDSYRNIQN